MSQQQSGEFFEELIEYLQFVEDPRVAGRCKHKLIDILVISVCAVLCGADKVIEIQYFSEERKDWLRQYLELPAGIPSHDTIARVLSLIDGVQLGIAFSEWVQNTLEGMKGSKTISLDGKCTKGNERKFNGKRRPLHMVSAYSHELGLSLVEGDSKSSGLAETKAAMDCLKVLDLRRVMVMADAGLNTLVLLSQILEQKGNYIVPIKKNSKKAYKEIKKVFSQGKMMEQHQEEERAHGRKEQRECRIISSVKIEEEISKRFPKVKTLIEMKRTRRTKDKRFTLQETGRDGKQKYRVNENIGKDRITEELVYYVSSKKLTAQQANVEIRKHWGIENKLHWVLDVAFAEDKCLVQAKKLARTLSTIRKIAYNLIRNSSTKGSVKSRIKRAGWNIKFMEKVIFGAEV